MGKVTLYLRFHFHSCLAVDGWVKIKRDRHHAGLWTAARKYDRNHIFTHRYYFSLVRNFPMAYCDFTPEKS